MLTSKQAEVLSIIVRAPTYGANICKMSGGTTHKVPRKRDSPLVINSATKSGRAALELWNAQRAGFGAPEDKV